MKKLLVILFAFASINCMAQQVKELPSIVSQNGKRMIYNNGQFFELIDSVITAKYKQNIKKSVEIIVIKENKLGFIDIKVPKGEDIEEYAEKLRLSGDFEVIEYNSLGSYSFTPNDTYRTNQWYLNQINAYNAWNITTGSQTVIIAIIDSGVDWGHGDIGTSSPDTYQNIYLNTGEDAWSTANNPSTGNGIDDDNNGLIDDWKGWNYGNNSNDTRTSNFHGTAVAGIASAKTNNNKGIAGIAGGNNSVGAKLLPYCIGTSGPITSVIDDAIIDAVDKGARVINMSFFCDQTASINSAIQYAIDNDVILVAASGNNNRNYVSYPASNSNVIAVGATDTDNSRASFSNYGSALDIMAPGVDIYSTGLSNSYVSEDGTSFAASQVSGVAALILSVNPLLTTYEVRDIIESTAQKVRTDLYTYSTVSGRTNGTWSIAMGYGLIDAYAAVNAAKMVISGVTHLCSTGSPYTILNISSQATINWTPTNAIQRVSANGSNPCTFRAAIDGMYSTIGATVSRNGVDVILPLKTVWVGGPATPTILPSSNVTTEIEGLYYTVPRYTSDVFFQMAQHDYAASELNEWSYTGVNNMYEYSQSLDMTTYNLGENEVIASQYNYCSTGPSNAYFIVEVIQQQYAQNESYILLSPNPASEYVDISVSLDLNEKEPQNYTMEILNSSSEIVKKSVFSGAFNKVNIQDLKAGYYIVRITYGKNILTKTLIVR